MPISTTAIDDSTLEVIASDKLSKEDYDQFVPQVEGFIEAQGNGQGKIGMLIHVKDFKGWTPRAIWEDLKFDVKHYRDIKRIALVGKGDSQEWMATISKPFTAAKVEYFDETKLYEAREWVVQ